MENSAYPLLEEELTPLLDEFHSGTKQASAHAGIEDTIGIDIGLGIFRS